MSKLKDVGKCRRCGQSLCGDSYGPWRHWCPAALERWQIFDNKNKFHRDYSTERDANAHCKQLNSIYEKGKDPYRVAHMIEDPEDKW